MSDFRLPQDRERLGRWRFHRPLPELVRRVRRLCRTKRDDPDVETAYLGDKPLAHLTLSVREDGHADGVSVVAAGAVKVHPCLWWARFASAERLLEAVLDFVEAWPWGVRAESAVYALSSTREVTLWAGAPPGLSQARARAVVGTALALGVSGVPASEAIAQALAAPQDHLVSGSRKNLIARSWVREVGHLEPDPGLAWIVTPSILWRAVARGERLGGFVVEPVSNLPSAVFSLAGPHGRWYLAAQLFVDRECDGRHGVRYVAGQVGLKDLLTILTAWPEKALIVPREGFGRVPGLEWRLARFAVGLRLGDASPQAVDAAWRRAVALAEGGTPLDEIAAWLAGSAARDAQAMAVLETIGR